MDIKQIKSFVNHTGMWERFDTLIMKAQKVLLTEAENKFCLAAVMLSTLFESWQRPGAVANCTLNEFKEATLWIMSI